MNVDQGHGGHASLDGRAKHACRFCRSRKIKCDRSKPACRTCKARKHDCVYQYEVQKPRPSFAIIRSLEKRNSALEKFIIRLKAAAPSDRNALLDEVLVDDDGLPQTPSITNDSLLETSPLTSYPEPRRMWMEPREDTRQDSTLDVPRQGEDYNVHVNAAPFVSMDEQGQLGVFGPTSGLHDDTKMSQLARLPRDRGRNDLIANALLQRQMEYELEDCANFDGVPPETALHLLDLHWNRQHHTFLLTYRPAFTRDLMCNGPYYSLFLLNAIFATTSKYSGRTSLRDDPTDPRTAGGRFFRRCKSLLDIERPSIPTVVGLLLLGGTFIARGDISKGWVHTGLATRMVYDLGLHLDIRSQDANPEDVEIRRRVYWGAFICDKLQSLYMGRPISMQIQDANVSLELEDSMEEFELWKPYEDPKMPGPLWPYRPTPIHSISTFQQFCELAKLMTKVLNKLYFVGARPSDAMSGLHDLDRDLMAWYAQLPPTLAFRSSDTDASSTKSRVVTPNVMLLHTTYHSLVVLLHRPFISDGHLRSISQPHTSWRRCSEAADNITTIMERWAEVFTLRRAPYLLGYAAYVACTIHVRNAALSHGVAGRNKLAVTLTLLDELVNAIPGISGVARIIRNLMQVNGVQEETSQQLDYLGSAESPPPDIDAIARMFPVLSDPSRQGDLDDSTMNVGSDFDDWSLLAGATSALDPGWNDLLTGFCIPPLDHDFG